MVLEAWLPDWGECISIVLDIGVARHSRNDSSLRRCQWRWR